MALLSGAMTHAPDPPVTAQLLGLESTKTWSLIATLFGDLDGDELSGKAIWSVLEPLGIKPEAMRVALHRLKKDGWIVSQKAGREVIYRLSDQARAETQAARLDVYRPDPKFDAGWRLVMLAPGSDPINGPHVVLDKALILVPQQAAVPDAALELTMSDPIPVWVEDAMVPRHLRDQAVTLTGLAKAFLATGPAGDTITARLLFLHYWRKMALRLGTWAHIGIMPDGTMAQCQRAITDVLRDTDRIRPKHQDT